MRDITNNQGRAPAATRRIVALDSDSGFLMVLGKRLQIAGWEWETTARRPAAKKLAAMDIDALVVDTALLGEQRLTWLSEVCALRPDLCVIVCTTVSTPADRVRALRAGVDDWLAKPCHPEELIARLEGATARRRHGRREAQQAGRVGEIEIRPELFQAFVGERSLGLTRREYQLLGLLCQARGEILPRERIYESLWGYEMVRNDRSVDVFVHKLRRKIELCSPEWSYIHTHFGVGYRLAPQRLAAPEPLAA
jgi:DNA-binding response OmpR family regulator